MSRALEGLHGGWVHPRRVRVLAGIIAPLLPPSASVLDVGCGDGLLASRLCELRPDLHVQGVDVLVRPNTAIPVRAFDGTHVPLDDGEMDAAVCVDVLHHAANLCELLRDVARVSSRIVLKDHLKEGFLAERTLAWMDRVGNARHGVASPGNYLTTAEWHQVFRTVGLRIERWIPSVPIYPPPASWIFGRRLHFVAVLTAEAAARPVASGR